MSEKYKKHSRIALFGAVLAVATSFVAPSSSFGQIPRAAAIAGDPLWRTNMSGMLSTPAGNMGFRDVERFERYMYSAMPYCGALTPADYIANQGLVRQWTGYLGTVNAAARDNQTRAAVVRAWRSIALFPCAYPAGQPRPAAAPVPPPQPAPPPFALQPPPAGNVSAADKETSTDLRERYGIDAAKAAAVWNNAEVLKISLELRGMSVNAATASAVGRFQLFFEQAATALTEHNWDEARSNLQAAEATTQKAALVVGN